MLGASSMRVCSVAVESCFQIRGEGAVRARDMIKDRLRDNLWFVEAVEAMLRRPSLHVVCAWVKMAWEVKWGLDKLIRVT